MDPSQVPEPIVADAVRVSSDVGDLWLSADDQVILPYMRSTGQWEPHEAKLLRSLLRPTSSFLDVGANIGYFSALAASAAPQGTIDAVEPEPKNVSLLRLNLWKLAPHACIWPLGLGTSRDVLPLNMEPGNPGNTWVERAAPRAQRLATICSGDELFEGRTFDVIKVDVQGFEMEVLSGLTKTLRKSRNVSLVVEFFPAALTSRGVSAFEPLRLYRSLGLDCVTVVAGELRRLDDQELISLCESSGENGFVNLLLRKSGAR